MILLAATARRRNRNLGRWSGRQPGSVSLMAGRAPRRSAPDERFFVTLDDGQTIVVDADEVTVLDDSAPFSG